MRHTTRCLTIALLTCADLLLAAGAAAKDQHVKLLADNVLIRFAASETAEIIATGQKGDVFRLDSEKSEWLAIFLFSGERRFVRKSDAQPIKYVIELPSSSTRRKELYRALVKAEDRAVRDADKKFPPAMIDKNIEYQRVLDDRYKLETMHKLKTQSPIYHALILEGVKARWR